MLLNHFGLREDPFGVTPDSRYFYETQSHREALASLIYGITASRGFMALIAQPGMGKTSLLNKLLQETAPGARTAFLFQTQCSSREFLNYLLSDLEVPDAGHDIVTMHRRLNDVLLQEAKAGRRCIAVIDEAQNLDHDVLETVRLLSDFETGERKLLQIVLAGQPALANKLAEPRQEQLRQRISSVSWLTPLRSDEVPGYIDYRLRTAGHRGARLFNAEAEALIADCSKGIPRNINNVCFNALSICCAENGRQVERRMVEEVLRDLNLQEPSGDRLLAKAGKSLERPAAGSPRPINAFYTPVSRVSNTETSVRQPALAPTSNWSGATYSRQATAPKLRVDERLPQPAPAAPIRPSRPQLVVPPARAERNWWGRANRELRRTLAVSLVSACAALAGVGFYATWQARHSAHSNSEPAPPTTTNTSQNPVTLDSSNTDASVIVDSTVNQPIKLQPIQPKIQRNSQIAPEKSAPVPAEKPAALEPSMGSFHQKEPDSTPITPPPLSTPQRGSSASGVLPLTSSSAAAMPTLKPVPRPPVYVGEPEQQGVLLAKVTPTYPRAAQLARIGGEVELEALVDKDGSVKEVRVLSGHVMLRQAAVDAVRRWRYQPYRVDGVPIEYPTRVTITFKLNEPS